MDQDFNLNVKVNTQEAVQELNNLKGAADQAAESVGKIGQKAEETAGKVDKVGDAADKSLPKIQGLGSAFEGVFSDALQGASQLGGSVGDISKSVSKAIPVVKKLNSTAISGLKGVRAALAATGIGIFITAIGLITTHWEGFLKAVGSSKEKFQEFKDKAIEVLGNVVAGIVGVGNVIFQGLITPVRTAIRAFTGLGNIIRDVFTGQWGKIKDDAKDAIDSIKESWSSSWDIQGNYKKGQEAGQKFVQGVTTMLTYKSPEVKKAGGKAGKDVGEEFIKELQKAVEKADEVLSLREKKRDLGKIRIQYSGISDEAASSISSIRKQAEDELKALSEGEEKLLEGVEKLDYLRTSKRAEDREKYERYLKEVNENTRKYLTERLNIILDLQEEERRLVESSRIQSLEELGKEEVDEISPKEYLTKIHERRQAEFKAQKELLDIQVLSAKEKNNQLFAIELERLDEEKVFLQQQYDLELEGSKKREELAQEIADNERQRSIVESQQREQRKKDLAEEVQAYADAATSIASIFGTVAQAEEERIQRQYENNKISKEQAEEQFETVKGWQLAENWINTAAGITRALTSIETSKGVKGWIAQAAQAAALLANGIAQDRKIRQTQFGGGATGGGGDVPSVGVTPIKVTDDIQQSPSVLASSQSPRDQRVYILEGDIQDSNKRVEVRESNSTF